MIRRSFLKLLAFSLPAAYVPARWAARKVISASPHTEAAEPKEYALPFSFDRAGKSLLLADWEGRPVELIQVTVENANRDPYLLTHGTIKLTRCGSNVVMLGFGARMTAGFTAADPGLRPMVDEITCSAPCEGVLYFRVPGRARSRWQKMTA